MQADSTAMSDLILQEHDLGLTWVHKEAMARTCHALVDDGRVWLIDPTDEDEALDRAAALGEPAGVLQLLDRHNRDCAAIAARLGVGHHVVPDAVPGSPLTAIGVVRLPRWRETALWWPDARVLVVAETVGTNAVYAVGPGPVGVHPFLRLLAPGALRPFEPEHLLVGHGTGVHGPAAAPALQDALARSRRDIPRLAARLPALARAARA